MPPNIENDELQKSPVLLLKNVFAVMNYKTLREVWHLRISNIERVLTLTYIKHRERFDTYVYKTSREVWHLRISNIERGLTLTYIKHRERFYIKKKHRERFDNYVQKTSREVWHLRIALAVTWSSGTNITNIIEENIL